MQRLSDLINSCLTAQTSNAKGAALEELAKYLFGEIPGVKHYDSNVVDNATTQEIDVSFYNDQIADGVKALPVVLLVECKNWADPVGSFVIRDFGGKLRNTGLDGGILIAANGITGDATDLTSAHNEIANFLTRDKIKIIVMTLAEIQTVQTIDDLINLFKSKLCRLHLRRTSI